MLSGLFLISLLSIDTTILLFIYFYCYYYYYNIAIYVNTVSSRAREMFGMDSLTHSYKHMHGQSSAVLLRHS
jgi:hypothetical protein